MKKLLEPAVEYAIRVPSGYRETQKHEKGDILPLMVVDFNFDYIPRAVKTTTTVFMIILIS